MIWDYKNTKSETGSLTEFFRDKISQKRTIHPIHSVSIFGPNYKDIPDHNCKSSFGLGSTWEWLSNNKNVCNLSMGIGLNGGAIFVIILNKSIKLIIDILNILRLK